MATLYCDGTFVSDVEVAETFVERWRGLLGREVIDGALLLPNTSSVHTIGMLVPIDVAFLDDKSHVLDVITMVPYRLSRPRRRARAVVEAAAGSFDKWNLRVGSHVEVRP
jgi:uncharacterized protein